MKNILMLVFIIFAGWKFYYDSDDKASKPVQTKQSQQAIKITRTIQSPIEKAENVTQLLKYKCDGRQHCSQMKSCDEATYFIEHCPDTKMDGDGDGVPCERQWCG